MEQTVERKEPMTLTDHLRVIFAKVLAGAGNFIHGLGIHPNVLTLTGVFGTILGAFFLAQGDFTTGGIIILLMGPIDALDGAVARAKGEPEDFGAFVDSVSDRYIELSIFGGLLWHYVGLANMQAGLLIFLAASGTVLVSYVRARAQSLGFEAKVGALTRVERFVILAPSIIFGYPLVGVTIIAIGAHITALHRILYVRRQAKG